jgi:small subunit ribosomal protein S1
MGWSRVSDSSSIVKPGEEITVKVLRVDEDKQEDLPRVEAAHRRSVVESPPAYKIGQVRTGCVTRIAEFGAFVEL